MYKYFSEQLYLERNTIACSRVNALLTTKVRTMENCARLHRPGINLQSQGWFDREIPWTSTRGTVKIPRDKKKGSRNSSLERTRCIP